MDSFNRDYGKTLINWHFPEFEKQEKSFSWYLIVFILSIALLIYSISTLNFLFAVIIIMTLIIIFLHERKEPLELEIKIKEAGIEINDKRYSYKEISKFYIIYEPPEISNLYFEFKSRMRPTLSIPLKDQNPVKIRDLLLNFLTENVDIDEELTSDSLTRWLKL